MKDFDEPSVSNSALPVVSSPSSAFTFEFEIPEHPASPFQAALPPRFLRRFQKPTEDVLPNDNEGQLDLNGTMPFRFGPPRPQTASDTDSESDQESGSGSESELDIESVPIALRKHQNRPSIYTDEVCMDIHSVSMPPKIRRFSSTKIKLKRPMKNIETRWRRNYPRSEVCTPNCELKQKK